MNTKQQFYHRIIEKYPDSEIALLIQKDELCGFFDVCQKFLDIALNAPKVKTDDGKLGGVFQYSDIDIAKATTIDFIKKFDIKNIDSIFTIIESEYPKSGEANDKRQKSGLLRGKNVEGFAGYAGTLYFFTRISDDVFQKIVRDIKKEI